MSLLVRLFLLVAIALLPVIAIEAYNEFALVRSRQVEAQDQALASGAVAGIHALEMTKLPKLRTSTSSSEI